MVRLALFFFCLTVSAQVRYATTSGSSGNDGTSELQAWTLAHGLGQLTAGMTLYVKAGDYGALTATINANGTSGSPIRIVGYKTTINDINATSGCTLVTTGTPNAAESPVLMGTTTTNRPNQEFGLTINGDYVQISNFATFSYSFPMRIFGENCIVDNFFGSKAGNHNPADLGGFSTTFPTGSYVGHGIVMEGENARMTNTYILNAGAEGIKVQNSNNFYHANNTVNSILGVGPYFGDFTLGDGNSTDYHYLFGNNSTNGQVFNATVLQPTGMTSDGHGICVKVTTGNPSNNITIDGFLVENSKLETQFVNVTYITFKNGELRATNTDERIDGTDANIASGSQFVTLENVKFTGGAHLTSRGWQDIQAGQALLGAVDLTVKNCWFEGNNERSAIWIAYGPGNVDGYVTTRMTIDHCTFNNYTNLFATDAPSVDVNIYNSIVNDVANYNTIRFMDGAGPLGGTGGPYTPDDSYFSTNFSNGFAARSGTDITTLDPSLVEGKTTNPTLQVAGVETTNYAAGLPLGYLGLTEPVSNTTDQQKARQRARNNFYRFRL